MKIKMLNNIIIFCSLLIFTSKAFSAKSFSTRTTAINKISYLISSGNSKKASVKLLSLLRFKEYNKSKPRVYFLLGLAFEKLQLKRSSVWALLESIKSSKGKGRYAQTSLTRLLLTANSIEDNQSIKKALSVMSLTRFPSKYRAKLYYILAKNYFEKRNFSKAVRYFFKIKRGNALYFLSRYFLANSLVEQGKFTQALRVFKKIVQASKPYTKMHTAALLGQARIYYQLKRWKRALKLYYNIPRDSEFWVEALQESAWTELRLNKLNMALRHFQTIHSSYYKRNYIPESLILRAVVYLKLCRYEEVKKILSIYNQEYKGVLSNVSWLLRKKRALYSFYIKLLRKKNVESWKAKLASSGPIKKLFQQIIGLAKERKKLRRLFSSRSLAARPVFKNIKSNLLYSKSYLRIAGELELVKMRKELINLKKQKDFIRYELLKSKQTSIKKKIAEKKLGIKKEEQEEDKRNYYIQNGYEYWPFQGEYWLDELGNYYYIGGSSCAR
ncbi:MAG: tetratricopeptide repeat protein [Bdellovibrionaceae bacterium]|nr:tetratricopeptide repeat protein [Pseudobdellovibrionaceae bacterium]